MLSYFNSRPCSSHLEEFLRDIKASVARLERRHQREGKQKKLANARRRSLDATTESSEAKRRHQEAESRHKEAKRRAEEAESTVEKAAEEVGQAVFRKLGADHLIRRLSEDVKNLGSSREGTPEAGH